MALTAYETIYGLYLSTPLRRRIAVACVVAARGIFGENGATSNHANRLIWARQAIADVDAMALTVIWGVLSDNAVRTAGENATDAQVQSALDAVVDTFAIGA